jgi:hypothetical protein
LDCHPNPSDSCLILVRSLSDVYPATVWPRARAQRIRAGHASGNSSVCSRIRLHAQGLFVKKYDCIKGLILGAGGDIVFGQMSQKPFQLLLARHIMTKHFEAVAISPEPGAVTPPSGERRMLPPKPFGKSARCFIGIHTAILIHEPPVVY